MKSDGRALVGFLLLGVLLVILAIEGPKLATESPVSALPTVTASAPPPPAPPPPGTPLQGPLLLQYPSLSKTEIAFSFAGEIWTVAREGGVARRIVSGQLRNSRPIFSPDGSQIAFTGTFDGNTDVYVVPSTGGELKRLTWGPGTDIALGFTPDGKRVLFLSTRATMRDLPQLFTVPLTGGFAEELPLPSGVDAAYSPDATHLAYIPFPQWEPGWKKYRGGQATPIWIADLADSKIVKVPRADENQRRPMWDGDSIYFISDKDGPFSLWATDTKGGAARMLWRDPNGWDVRSASAGPGAIVFETLGALHLYDLASHQEHPVKVEIADELPQVRARFENVSRRQILHAAVSPTGKRALFEAHGEILSVPKKKGDVRNLTRSPGVADRDPAWSPDGKWIAWLSDQGGEYALYFRAPDGLGPTHFINLGDPPSYFYSPRWSPDSKKIALTDKRLNLWLIDIERPTPQKIDTAKYEGAGFDETWSHDSKWLTYVKELDNHFHAIFVYSLDEKKAHQVTDARSDASSPRFDRDGKLLYFLASTDVGLGQNNSEMTSMARPVTSSVYAAVLQKDVPSPLAPESDEEGSDAGADGGAKKKKGPTDVRIDFDGIDQRIIAMPMDRTNWQDLEVAENGAVFVTSAPTVMTDEDYERSSDEQPQRTVMRYDPKKRKAEFFTKIEAPKDDLATFQVTADGKSVLFARGSNWFITSADAPPKDDDGKLPMGDVSVWIDPRAEWKQIYHEIWRIERDFLYDAHAHGLDLAAAEKTYEPFLAGISGRADLNALFEEMLSNLVLGHVWAQGGDYPRQDHVNVGLLGADYKIENGRYRFARILHGENWNPGLRAPLTEPGVDVKEGDYLITVNGQELKGDDDVDRLFQGRAGKQTVITVDSRPEGSSTRTFTVVPIGSDGSLRLRTWMEDNHKKVSDLSQGRVGYVYIPDTHGGGLTNFDRYYFTEVGKDAVVIDERFNHGGYIADYIVNVLQWTPQIGAATREGDDIVLPQQAIYGPKVMIANQMSGSGGDALPWLFKKAKVGTLVGVRTWGGLVGIGGYPQLIDGGSVTAPRWALYGTSGQWEVENHGIAPDVEVEQDPALVRQGHDPQLERAVAIAMDDLAKNPPKKLIRPAYPNYGDRLPRAPPP
ncbi:MAG TPA: PDZ domain-containing protein [Polyangiaceae bacterium]